MAMQRSRNRLREHGDHWLPIRIDSVAAFGLGGGMAVLFVCDPSQCRWAGWIPLGDCEDLGIDISILRE